MMEELIYEAISKHEELGTEVDAILLNFATYESLCCEIFGITRDMFNIDTHVVEKFNGVHPIYFTMLGYESVKVV